MMTPELAQNHLKKPPNSRVVNSIKKRLELAFLPPFSLNSKLLLILIQTKQPTKI